MHRIKTCDHCHEAKPATEQYFGPNLRQPDRLQPHCLACRPKVLAERRRRKNERSREWAAANREKARESARASYQKHRRERLAYYRKWRQENKERINEYQREYAQRKRQETR